jgi:hypothetical protein
MMLQYYEKIGMINNNIKNNNSNNNDSIGLEGKREHGCHRFHISFSMS